MTRTRRLDGRRAAPAACVGTGLVSAAAGAAVGRDGAALGALVATLLVLAFFSMGALPVLLVGGDTSRAALGFLILQMTYVLRLVGLLAVLAVVKASGQVDTRWLALTLIALTLVWTGTRVALLSHSDPSL